MKARRRPLWVVIPAAGTGARFGGSTPKQYLPLAGRSVIEWAMRPFLQRSDVAGVFVVVSPGDHFWSGLGTQPARVVAVDGGSERALSVLNGLEAVARQADAGDRVLVHDAARPCLTDGDLEKLLSEVCDEDEGGLLAVPAGDTLKRGQGDRVVETVDRRGIWRALTPQMFRVGELIEALRSTLGDGVSVTDESAAMERAGARPRLVTGRADNIKITRPEDLPLAGFILARTGIA